MKCSQCQAELSDSATICPRCGTPRQQSQSTSFSYLPAGAPPWPTTVPSYLSYAQAPAASPSAVPVSSGKKERPRRSVRGVLLTIAILVLVPILGSVFTLTNLYVKGDLFPSHSKQTKATAGQVRVTPGVQQTPSTAQGDQLPAAGSFSNTSDKDLNVSLKYPSDWQAGPPNKSSNAVAVGIYPSQKYVIFIVERYLSSASAQFTDTNALNQATINDAGTQIGATGAQKVTLSNAKPTIGGSTWDETDVIFSDTSGGKEHFASISVLRNKSYYNIAFLTPDTVHDEAMKKFIQPMLDSVQFLS